MMKYVNENKNSLVITQNGEAKAVLMEIEYYQMMKDAFHLLKILQLSEKDIQNGRYKTIDNAFAKIRKKYNLDGKKD